MRAAGEQAQVATEDAPGRWDIYREEEQSAIAPSSMWKVRIDHKFTDADLLRFAKEREVFRADDRLRLDTLKRPSGGGEMDWMTTLKGTLGVLRLGDYFTEPFRDLVVERLTEHGDLMEHFMIPPLLDRDATKPLHNHAVPEAGAYAEVRMQAYWLALHIWLLHSKQHVLQETEGVFGSALCALITRRLFEWSWNQVRGWMHEVDVPVMSLTGEVQDLQEYVFGFCVALDQAFKDEASATDIAGALALSEKDILEGCHGLAPLVKHVLWANVYSGACPHDAPHLTELTVYVLRQRAMLEAVARNDFYMCKWNWAQFEWTPLSDESRLSTKAEHILEE